MSIEDESDGLLSSLFSKLFKKEDASIEKFIDIAGREGELSKDEVNLLHNVLRLGRKQVREIMIPRTDIFCVPQDTDMHSIMELILSCGHSRIPVYTETRDNIIGIVMAKDLLRSHCSTDNTLDTDSFIHTPLFIPDTKSVLDMLHVFRSKKMHMAIALDEYGGTSGLVTLEDVLEEIVGEIEDEYDAPKPKDIRVLEDGTILVSGRTPLYELEEEVGITLDSEQVETVSGFICELAGRVPVNGESFEAAGCSLKVKEADTKQVHWLTIKRMEPAGEQEQL